MKAYKSSMALVVISGVVISNAMCIYIIADLIYLFWIKQRDPGVYFGVGLFVLLLCGLNFVAWRGGIVKKLFLKIATTQDEIQCYGLFIRKHGIAWADVKSYGISSEFVYPLIFISTREERNIKLKYQFEKYSKNRVTLQVLDGTWEELSRYMPEDMKNNLGNALKTHSDGKFYR
ncbi:MAG: hypothetical protein IKM61_05310 [Eubacteriaceae bacterium]|nr:hypothetical protein [Eubacteriaceae bacterium]